MAEFTSISINYVINRVQVHGASILYLLNFSSTFYIPNLVKNTTAQIQKQKVEEILK
jgi:hypothetical protein